MVERKFRGLEDTETFERKKLHRDVRSPLQRFLDMCQISTMQTTCIWGAGVCLFLFPLYVTPLFVFGVIFFVLRCFSALKERLPFRMPLGSGGKDRGDPLPGRSGFATPEGIFFLGNRSQDKQELWLKAKDILTHALLFGEHIFMNIQ